MDDTGAVTKARTVAVKERCDKLRPTIEDVQTRLAEQERFLTVPRRNYEEAVAANMVEREGQNESPRVNLASSEDDSETCRKGFRDVLAEDWSRIGEHYLKSRKLFTYAINCLYGARCRRLLAYRHRGS